MRTLIKICLLALSFVFVSGTGRAETLDRIVATVNGDIILYSELQQSIHLLEKASPSVKTDDPARRADLERTVLQQMIRERLTQEEVKRLKITVSQHDVDNAVEGIKADNKMTDAQLQAALQREGQTLDQFKDSLKKQIERNRLVDRVLKSKVVITESQVDAYAKSGGTVTPGREVRRVGVILIPSGGGGGKQDEQAEKSARDIYNSLKSGRDFSGLAKQYSKGPAAEDGGDIGYVTLDELTPAISSAIKDLKVNEYTNVVKSSDGYYILKIIDIKKEPGSTGGTLDREKARRELFQQEMNRRFEEWIRGLESKAFIQVSL